MEVAGRKAGRPPVALAEQGHFWVGVRRVAGEHGTLASGEQMYVEFRIPADLRRALPIVMVHGGGGQGLDYLGRLDGGPGWADLLVAAGFAVYVVDRPGLGRSPLHPALLGPMTPTPTYEMVGSMFARAEGTPTSVLDRSIDATMASSGPSMADLERSHELWRARGADLLDRIGPAVLFTHSMGGSFGWLVADERPELVRGIVAVEPVGPAFSSLGPGAELTWGLTASPLAYDPPAAEPAELATVEVTTGRAPYVLQEEPARRLVNLVGIPILVVSTDEPFFADRDPATVAFLTQAGCDATELCLRDHGIAGSRHFVMLGELAEPALEPILDWLDRRSLTSDAPPARDEEGGSEQLAGRAGHTDDTPGEPGSDHRNGPGTTAPAIAHGGHFWVGVEPLPLDAGTVARGQMFVRYLVPAAPSGPFPLVLVHGDGMQGLVWFGPGGGEPGWVHRLLAAGYATYVVDRPGQGRPPFDPEILGPMAPPPSLEHVARMHPGAAAAAGGVVGVADAAVDQLLAQLGPSIADVPVRRALDRTRGVELLDRIGPAVLVTHSSGAELAWLSASERPELVKAVVAIAPGGPPARAFPPQDPDGRPGADLGPTEARASGLDRSRAGDVAPFAVLGVAEGGSPERLAGIPIACVGGEPGQLTAEEEEVAAALRRAGASVSQLRLPGLGMAAASPFALVGDRRDEVLGVVLAWLADVVG